MTMKLHCFAESGNAYKVALALDFAGLDWEAVYIDFFNGAARSDSFKALNEMGEIPVLIDGGATLTQSGVILDYLAEKTGRFGGATPEARREILRWILWDNHKLSGLAGNTRFLMNFLPEDKRPAGVAEFQRGRLKASYGVLDTHLAGRDWIVGDDLTTADLSCCGYLYYPEPFGFDRADWPNIDAWLSRIADRPGWKHPYELMPPAHPMNQMGDAE